MKKLKLTILLTFILSFTFAQVPNSFSYQGVAYNSDGTPAANQKITVEVTILQGFDCSVGCKIIWQELHYPTTNSLGMFNIEIGKGQSTFAGSAPSFDKINWADRTNGDYYLRIRVDFGNSSVGNSMINLGTVKILSVPYSIVAKQASSLVLLNNKTNISLENLADVDTSNLKPQQTITWNGSQWVNSFVANILDSLANVKISNPSNGQVLIYQNPYWINSNLTLNQLQDVYAPTPAPNQVLTYTTANNWQPQTLSLKSLSDIDTSTPNINNILQFNGSYWQYTDPVWISQNNIVSLTTQPQIITFDTNNVKWPNERFRFKLDNNDFIISAAVPPSSSSTVYSYSNSLAFYGSLNALSIGVNLDTNAVGKYSVSIGDNLVNSGQSSVNIGSQNSNYGLFSLILGYKNSNSSTFCTIFGSGNDIGLSSDFTFISGSTNSNSGSSNTIFGSYNNVGGGNNICIGGYNYLYSNTLYSLVSGLEDTVAGNYSVAIGVGLLNRQKGATVIGQYNAMPLYNELDYADTLPLFVIGNGTGYTDRHNALVVRRNGNVYAAGTLYTTVANPYKYKYTYPNSLDYQKLLNLQVYNQNIDPRSAKKLFPKLVSHFNNNYAIAYSNFVPILIEAIQEQNKIIKQQKQTIAKQQKQIQQLAVQMLKLQQQMLKLQAEINQLKNSSSRRGHFTPQVK